MSLLTGEARSATVKTLEYATVIQVDKALFSTFLASNPQICEKLGAVMAQRQQDLSQEANKKQDKLTNQVNLISKIKAFFGIWLMASTVHQNFQVNVEGIRSEIQKHLSELWLCI